MEKEHFKSVGNDAKGKAKEAAGKATDDKELEAKGKADQLKAKGQKLVGDVKDALD